MSLFWFLPCPNVNVVTLVTFVTYMYFLLCIMQFVYLCCSVKYQSVKICKVQIELKPFGHGYSKKKKKKIKKK